MLDWVSRIDEFADKLAREYNIDDRPVIEILLSALVECPRTPSSWLVLETNWYSRDCRDAWFSFGETWKPCALPRLRQHTPWRMIESEMIHMVEDAESKQLFVECDYERFPYFHRVGNSPYLLQRSLRVRMRSHKTAGALLELDRRCRDQRSDSLKAAANYVLTDRVQSRPVDPPHFIQPKNFLYHVELIQKLNPWFRDWDVLLRAFAVLAVRRAFLHGRTETDESDCRMLARVLHDSIPLWIKKLLVILVEGPSKTATLEKHMALEDKTRRSGHGAHSEIIRLHRAGLIFWSDRGKTWNLREAHQAGIEAALGEKTFQ